MRVIETSLEEDLSLFSRYLWQNRVAHRIYEERGAQIVEVAEAHSVDPVRKAYQDWRAGTLVLESRPAVRADPGSTGRRVADLIRRYPVLAALLVTSLALFPFSLPVADGNLTDVAAWLTIVDLRPPAVPGWENLLSAQIWRWFTPVFLHFSVMHIAFNLAVTAEFGRRVELGAGSTGFLVIVLVVALASNLGQFLVSGNPVFGGLSGVGYGLLGYVLARRRQAPDEPVWQVHMGFAWSLLIFLVLFSTGMTEPFGLHVANTAHWIGLVTGALLGWLPVLRVGRS